MSTQRFQDPWQAANHLQQGARVRVRYDSRRSDDVQEKEGRVTALVVPTDATKATHDLDYDLRIEFTRDDGQRMYVYDSQELHTASSMYPHVGDVLEIEVIGGIEDPIGAPEPATDPIEISLIAAENHERKNPSASTLDVLQAALNRLEEMDVNPKNDWSDDQFTEWMEALADRTSIDFDSDDE